MEEKKITFNREFKHLSNYQNLPKEIIETIEAAKIAAKNAYAPYSKFYVGAAVLLQSGKIIKGNNQENACYPTGLCAERVALFNANSNYPKIDIDALAITIDYSKTSNFKGPVFPCGSCRQSILEYENMQGKAFPIFMIGAKNDVVIVDSIQDILPFTFSNKVLEDYQK